MFPAIYRLAALVLAVAIMGGCAEQAGKAEAGEASGGAARETAPARPNVILIMADDVGYADISTYEGGRIPTPNIDSIADSGVLFTDGYASAPVCAPSRAGLMTGRYQDRFGFEYNHGPATRDVKENYGLPTTEVTLATALKEVGYHTGLVGKWHLGANPDYYPMKRGFDEFVGFLTGATAYIDLDVPGVRTAKPPYGDLPHQTRTKHTQVIEGPDRTVVHNEQEYLTDYFGRRASEFITRNAAEDEPYFLYLAPSAAHDPLVVTEEYYNRFPEIENEMSRVYAAMVSSLDDMVGDVLDAVEASGEAENTMIIFLTDNGCASYYAGLCACEPYRGGKLSHYEGGVRVPFMMKWPAALPQGRTYSQMVSALDIFPTVLAAAGGALRDDRVYDGVDLAPFLNGGEGQPHEMLAWRRLPMASIRIGDWKLWKNTEGEFTFLFNLAEDPNETENLATSQTAKMKELEGRFDSWSAELPPAAWPSRDEPTFNVCGQKFTFPI